MIHCFIFYQFVQTGKSLKAVCPSLSHCLYEGLFLFVDNIRHLDRMRLLTEQEQIFSDKISVFRFDPAILGCFKLVRYGFLYLFDNLFVFPDAHVLTYLLQIFHREIVLFAIE